MVLTIIESFSCLLGGTSEIADSRIYRYPWLNQYTNTIFVNFYTLGIMMAGVTLFRIIIKKKTFANQR